LPQIVGTPAFYQELGAGVEAVYEIQDRWEFDEAIQDVKRSADCRSIIEIGSGGGVFLERATTITDAFGIEYNPDAVAHLRTKGLSVYGIDEQEKLAARKGQFDAVFSFQVLEHVPDPVAFVQSCKDWVRPGGKIGVCVPNSAGFLRHFHNDFFNLPPHHTTLWSAHTLTALAECLNLQVERVAYQPLYHYHYSLLLTWWKDVMRGESFVKRHVRYRGAQLLSQLLQILPKLGIKRLPLRGHSVYILLRLPETR
jgi:SAM-dependent methyltransferase